MKVRAHVFVNGRVQGIFFRANTQEQATRLGVSGWVRNTRDGRVEAVFEGEREKVDGMLKFCRKGPPGARVSDVEVKWEDYRGGFSEFQVRYWD